MSRLFLAIALAALAACTGPQQIDCNNPSSNEVGICSQRWLERDRARRELERLERKAKLDQVKPTDDPAKCREIFPYGSFEWGECIEKTMRDRPKYKSVKEMAKKAYGLDVDDTPNYDAIANDFAIRDLRGALGRVGTCYGAHSDPFVAGLCAGR